MRFVFALSFVAAFTSFACSSGDAGPSDGDAGGDAQPPSSSNGGSDGGASSDSSSAIDTGTIGTGIPPACETYADKGVACCASMSGCNVTRDTFLKYCEGFYPSCQKYYACYLGAATCADAENCPGAGAGGCQ